MSSSQAAKQDIVDVLEQQHRQIKIMFSEVGTAPAHERRERFEDLVRFLAVHESAEELVVHPEARETGVTIEAAVELRLTEEKQAKQALADLYEMGPDHPEFDEKFARFTESVLLHAEKEEEEEFPALRNSLPADKRERMARTLLAAEKLAPTRPHPHAGESMAANLIAGPPLGVFDRIRDAMRDLRERDDSDA